MEPRADTPWRRSGKTVILVPGQVEDDASIRFGCTDVRTNIALLKAARAARPDAFIVYKPHPAVGSGHRTDRKSGVSGKRVEGRGALGGDLNTQKKKKIT